jgi:hypothetical protein
MTQDRHDKALETFYKEAITKALGFGLWKPLKTIPPIGEWGYDPNYNPRPYNPDKAKQLELQTQEAKKLAQEAGVVEAGASQDQISLQTTE